MAAVRPHWVIGACILPAMGLAQNAPLSAIDWLNEAMKAPQIEVIVGPPAPPPAPISAPPVQAMPDGSIRPRLRPHVTADPKLRGAEDDVAPDASGILSAEETGLPRDLWAEAALASTARLIRAMPTDLPAPAQILFDKLLLAKSDAPLEGETLFLARLDALIARGALDQAQALLNASPEPSQDQFLRAFDIALLAGSTAEVCEQLRKAPGLGDNALQRSLCLMRGGDHMMAQQTLIVADALGSIDAQDVLLMERFLDPELFETGAPVPNAPLTPMRYVLREANGLDLPHPLPLPYLYIATGGEVPPRARMLAAERLVAAGAMPARVLFDMYRAQRPAASGGVWDRSDAVRKLDEAISFDKGVAHALEEADAILAPLGLRPALALSYANRLPENVESPAARRLRLLAGMEDATDDLPGALARDAALPDTPNTPLASAIRAGFADESPEAEGAEVFAPLLAQGRAAEVILHALMLLGRAERPDLDDLTRALWALRQVDQSEAARAIALHYLLS